MHLNCPVDKKKMHEVVVESNYGLSLVLDQCPDCGGLWIDKDELHKTKKGEAKRIEKLNTKKLRKLTKIEEEELWCPHQHARLLQFRDRYFPKSIQVEKCPVCFGFWFNRGEFAAFQEKMLKPGHRVVETSEEMEDKVEDLIEADAKSNKDTAVDRLGRFLATKEGSGYTSQAGFTSGKVRKPTMKVGIGDYHYAKEELKLWFDRYVVTVQAIIVIIHLLLRLLLRK
jgi:Zn-finger nucleic acid-binding protein